ncbi:MAG TPA: hypothetical protein VHA73_06590 [Acidimicrobiales bacterium]|nr:hypothetical protein [Acidimicrobiales bacterium]
MAIATLVSLLLVAGCGGAKHAASTSTSSSSSSSSSTTVASTSSTSSTPPTAATTTTPANPDGPVVSAQGAELAPPTTTATPVPYTGDCRDLVPAGAVADGCGRGTAGSSDLAWVVHHGPGATKGVDIYRVGSGTATVALTATDPDGTSWTSVKAFTADVGGPPGDEIVVGYRLGGTGGQLHVDVVGAAGVVQFHRELDQGRVQVSDGVYHDWAAQFGPDDPNCCPSVYEAETVDYLGGQWRVGRRALVPPTQVPASEVP